MAISARAEAAKPLERGHDDGRHGSTAIRVVVALTVIGAALRFATLDVQSLWGDESATVLLVHRSFSGMLSHLSSSESAPPLYYVIAWLWTHVFGTGTLGFRSLSALVGTLTIPVLYACGREVSERTGLWAAALATFSPAMYYYSQEARAYAMLTLFGALALLCFLRAQRIGDGRSLAWWAGTSALALLTHYFAVFLFVPEALLLLRRHGLRRMLAPVGAVCLVGIALAPLAISQRSDGKATWIEESSLANRTAETIKQFLVGLYGPLEIETAVVSGLIALGLCALAWQRSSHEHERRPGLDAAVVACVGVALPLLLALAHIIDVFDGRNVIAAWVPFAVVLALGAGAARSGRAGPALGGAACAVGIGVIVATNLLPGYQRDDWRDVAKAITATPGPHAVVGETFASAPLSVYLGQSLHGIRTGTITTREIDFATLRQRRTKGSPAPPYVPPRGPVGFDRLSVSSNEAYAVSRWVAPHPTRVRVSELLHLAGQSGGEVLLTR
jgi:mannosyltransferase